MEQQSSFHWERHPEAEKLIVTALEQACKKSPALKKLHDDLLHITSTRLLDFVDHIKLEYTQELEQALDHSGFISKKTGRNDQVFKHPGALLPRVVVQRDKEEATGVYVTVECISDFLMVRGVQAKIEGTLKSGYRRSLVTKENGVELFVVERRGTDTLEPTYPEDDYVERYLTALEMWKTRPRSLEDEDLSIQKSLQIAKEIVKMMGRDLAAWIVMEGERYFWQSRNHAGQLQKNRQDRLGMGWANHDHHTFRSSRRHFIHLVQLLETLGFHCRERYWAGKEGGWGAQIMENEKCGLVCFLDLDLAEDEVEIDFAHQELPELPKLATVGLWCALHGDSILASGMHHLEAQFMFDELKNDLDQLGVGMMDPFSNFPYLKQAFTAGEIWHVNPRRVEKLLKERKITKEEAEKFLSYGAVGSHLENLQRRDGYKGFNQKNVTYIIKKTDPRRV